MNNIISNFNQILTFAQSYGLPIEKKRGILREYLQSLFISRLYALPDSQKLSFVGGTSLRLLRGLPRFSEDLDFDNLGLSNQRIAELINEVVSSLQRENIETELNAYNKDSRTYFTVKFPHLLFDLRVSTNSKEKVSIKVDYAEWWHDQETETIFLNRFGFFEQIVTNTLGCLLVQKVAAYLNRKETQPRDLYDLVWLFTQQAHYNQQFAIRNNLSDLPLKALAKFEYEGVSEKMKKKLAPFLFNDSELNKLGKAGEVLKYLVDILPVADWRPKIEMTNK